MRIIIETIPHKAQRYETVGDWRKDQAGNLCITVSELNDWRLEALVAVHELIEALLCRADGVTEDEVDHFDFNFNGEAEPGDDPDAPYYEQHQRASGYERLLAADLQVNWAEYEKAIDAL
jgi:hypothetical protein